MLLLCQDLLSFDLPRLLEVYAPERRRKIKEYLCHDFFLLEGTFLAIWEEEGVYTTALRLEPWENGYLVCGLETRKDCQGKGYGTKLLRTIPSDRPLYAHVAKKNDPSLAAHEKAGFVVIKDTARYLDGSADTKSYTLMREENRKGWT